MKLPSMKYADRITKGKQIKFAGLNHTLGAGDGDIWDMKNMTSDHYPVLAVREPRRLYRALTAPGGLYCWNELCWVDGTGFYYGGELKGQVTEGQKSFCAIGSNIIIWPDKAYYNVETDTFGNLEAEWIGEALTFTNGLLYGAEAQENTVYCEGADWGAYFKEGDAVTISGCTVHPENNKTPIIREIDGDRMYFYEHIFALEDGEEYQETGALTIARTVPDLKYLCENENRLWGCDDTTIYASKLGDPFNWNVYDGLSSDAFAVTPGSAGVFTGGISYKSFAVLFKEFRISKVYGSIPSSFKAVDSASIGIGEGNGESLAIAGEILFYLSNNGIMAYSGGIPQPIGEVFGMERFSEAVGGSDGLKYYVSMRGDDGDWWLYVYDTQRGLWHKEDQQHVTHFARWNGELFFLNDAGEIWCIGDSGEAEEPVEWMVEFADFTEEDPNKKIVSKLQLRLDLDEGADIDAWMQYDSDGIWHKVKSLMSEGPKRSYYLPLTPRRCDHYRLKLEGTGGCRIYSLTREYAAGSELKSTKGRN